MTPTAIADRISEPCTVLCLLPAWKQAEERMPEGLWPGIQPEAIAARRRACGLSEDCDAPLKAVAAKIGADRHLRALAWYLQWRVFDAPLVGRLSNLPTLHAALGVPLAGAFYLLLSLEFAPALEREYRNAGYPPDFARRTVARIVDFDSNHRRGRGCPGIYPNQYKWLRIFFYGSCIRLGRFEFQLGKCPENRFAWRKKEGTTIMLAADGQRFGQDGLAAAPGEDSWTATLRFERNCATGFPILPAGRALKREVRLRAPEWEPFLAPGVDILNLHIPSGGNMSFKACRDSFRAAHDFFSNHHREQRPAAILCTTWFLDPRLPQLMPNSNPARFQSALYCHPALMGSNGGLWFVFLDKVNDCPAMLPRDTSLQRALADFLRTGSRWHGGSMMVPFEDAGDLRENRYRERSERSSIFDEHDEKL